MNTAPIQSSIENPRFGSSLLFAVVGALALFAALMCFAFAKSLEAPAGAAGYSAPALFDQANAYARQGKTAFAIADYERARLLAPENSNIRRNLAWVREHAGLPPVPATWLDRAVSWASPNFFAYLGSAGLFLVGAGVLAAWTFPRGRFLFRLAAVGGVILLALCIINAAATSRTENEAVVLTSDAPARISPTTVGEVAFKLQAGELTKLLGRYSGFVLVEDSSGHSGWVQQGDLQPIIPGRDRHSL